MKNKKIILPNTTDYINYISKILMDSFRNDVPTNSDVPTTTSVAKMLANEEGFLIIEEEEA